MQCPSCRFENMPGVEVCGRCGSTLRIATAVLDVYPPRAGKWTKRFRRVLPVRRASYRLRDAASDMGEELRRASAYVQLPVPDWHVFARMVIPGWAHRYLGQRLRGNIFLGIYLALLLPSLFLFGTTGGSILLGLAFSAHASSVMDILFQCPGGTPSRTMAMFASTTLLGLIVYLPAGWLVTRVADPRMIHYDAAPFAEGDIVLVNQWAYMRSDPMPGDIVLYNTGEINAPLPQAQHGAIRVQAGQGIDRIIAGPGSEVVWRKGKLIVDGQPSPYLPLAPENLPPQLKSTVPPGSYLILPSTVNVQRNQNVAVPDAIWQNVAAVSRSQIVGKVYVRTQPLSRLWIIR